MNDILTHRVRATPETTALIDAEGRELSYAALDAMVERTAKRLSALGLESGDHLGLLVDTRVAAVRTIHAAMRVGCVLVPLNGRLAPPELESRIERADLTVLVCAADTEAAVSDGVSDVPVASVDVTRRTDVTPLETVEPVAFERASWAIENPAVMLSTSGTTGEPKLVVLTAKNLLASAVASAFRLGLAPEDRWLNPLSVCHMGGLAPVVRSALYGTTVVLGPEEFDPETTLAALTEHGCTGVSLVPTMLRRLLDAGRLPDSLRFVLLGGAPAPTELVERCARMGVPVCPTYGMTETASQAATARPDEAFAHPGTVGRPLFGTDLTVVDETDVALDPGETGELVVSGPTVFSSYYGDSEATTAAVSERGFHTGDVGYRDESGRVWVLGRLDDRIVTGGENVDPEMVASAIRTHPAVSEAAVVGIDDVEWGQRVAALVVADESLDAETLRTHCREHLAGFELPRTVAFADSLPRTASGTVERETVRERLAEVASNADRRDTSDV